MIQIYTKYRLRKISLKMLVSAVLCLSLTMCLSLFNSPKIAHAYSADGCSLVNATEVGCNVLSVNRYAPARAGFFGSFGFTKDGYMQEGFCITAGISAYSNNAGTYNGTVPLTLYGAHLVGVPEKGFGNNTENAHYTMSRLLDAYYAGALDKYAPYVGDLTNITVFRSMTNASFEHIIAAALVSFVVHAWFDDGRDLGFLQREVFAKFPAGFLAMTNRMVADVASVEINYSNPHIVMENNTSYLAVQMPTDQYIKGRSFSWQSGYAITQANPGEVVQICKIISYKNLQSFTHGVNTQSSAFLDTYETSREFCLDLAVPDIFRITVNNSMVQEQRYVRGDISDNIYYSYSGQWPCTLSDVTSPQGSCVQYAVINLRADLYQLGVDGGDAKYQINGDYTGSHTSNVTRLTSNLTDSITYNLTYTPQTTNTINVKFKNPLIAGIFTVQITLSYAGILQQHPASLSVPTDELMRESVSTYECKLAHSSVTDDYNVAIGQAVDDKITISGRCRGFDLPEFNDITGTRSDALHGLDTADVLLIGPLRSVLRDNSPSEPPSYLCADLAQSDCVYSKTTVDLKNGSNTFNLSEYIQSNSNNLHNNAPLDPGLYVYVYHYAGDVFTPEFWSNAADGREMFIVGDNHLHMWSVATETANIGEQFSDTVYISGNVRPGSYLTFDAYGVENPVESASCTQPIYDGSNVKIYVGEQGGVYKSPPLSVNEVGIARWVATLHNVDGTVYREYYADNASPVGNGAQSGFQQDSSGRNYVNIAGVCGEPGENTTMKWNVGLSSDARRQAVLPDVGATSSLRDTAGIEATQSSDSTGLPRPEGLATTEKSSGIFDVAHIVADGAVPAGIKVKFELYFDDGSLAPGVPLFTDVQQVTASGDYRSGTYIPTRPGKYFWVATILDQYNNSITQGDYGLKSETSYVLQVGSDTAQKYVTKDTETYDNLHISGAISDDFVLSPILYKVASSGDETSDIVVQRLDPIKLQPGISEHRTAKATITEVGEYYWDYQIIDTSDYSVLSEGAKRIDSESFNVIEITSQASGSKYIGEDNSDTVYFAGKFPENISLMWEVYAQIGAQTQQDYLVYTTPWQNLSASGIASSIVSPPYNTVLPGNYYWVAYVRDNATQKLVTVGTKRDPAESFTVKPLTNTAWTYSETPQSALVTQDFSDRVWVQGLIPTDGWVIWDLYKQAPSNNIYADQLVYSSYKVQLEFGNQVSENCVIMQSPPISQNEPGKYYWVEKVYSPLQSEPIAVGGVREETESIELLPLSHLLNTTSQALEFARIGENIYDYVKLFINSDLFAEDKNLRDDDIYALLAKLNIHWNIYKKNLHSDDYNDDKLVYTTNTVDFSDAIIDLEAETISIKSPIITLNEAGIYYWVEEVTGAVSNEMVAQQTMRNVTEMTVVEAPNTKYVKVGARRNEPTLLASTGVAFGNVLGIMGIVCGCMLAKFMQILLERRNKCTRKRKMKQINRNMWQV